MCYKTQTPSKSSKEEQIIHIFLHILGQKSLPLHVTSNEDCMLYCWQILSHTTDMRSVVIHSGPYCSEIWHLGDHWNFFHTAYNDESCTVKLHYLGSYLELSRSEYPYSRILQSHSNDISHDCLCHNIFAALVESMFPNHWNNKYKS